MTTTQTQGATAGEDDLTALTATMVQRMEGLFAPFRGTWDEEALIDYGLDFAREAVGKVELDRGKLSTFVCTVVKRRLLDLHRTLSRGKKREQSHGATRKYLSEGRAFDEVDEGLPLGDYIGAIYRQAVHVAGTVPTGRGTRCYEPAQEAALVAIQRRLKLSQHGVISFLKDRPEIVRSIRLKHLPSHDKIYRLLRSFSRQMANNRTMKQTAKIALNSLLVCEADAARIMGISAQSLSKKRREGKAPVTVQPNPLGLPRYLRAECERYMKARAVAPAPVEQATPPAGVVK